MLPELSSDNAPRTFLKNDGGKNRLSEFEKECISIFKLIHQAFTKLNFVIVKSLDKLGHLFFRYHYIIIVYKFYKFIAYWDH